MSTGRKNIIRFSFVEPQRADRAQGFPRQRDSEAFTEIYAALARDSYHYYDTILNYREELDDASEEDRSFALAQRVSPNDLIVVATRPPIQEEVKARKKIPTSKTWIERRILDACSDYFAISRRDTIVVNDRIQHIISRSCPIDAELKTDVGVYTRSWATYKYNSWSSSEDRYKTPTYLLRIPHIEWGEGTGPDLLVVFGMSAPLSLAWAHILRTRFPYLLEGHRFLMADLTLPKRLNPTPINLKAFCGAWEMKLIFDLKLPIIETPPVTRDVPKKTVAQNRTRESLSRYSYAAKSGR